MINSTIDRRNISLTHCERAGGYKTRWDSVFDEGDAGRIARVRQALIASETNTPYERSEQHNTGSFTADLKDHAAGFLAPLIEKIQVGWPSKILEAGVILVDLPGVGIAKDSYRQVTPIIYSHKCTGRCSDSRQVGTNGRSCRIIAN